MRKEARRRGRSATARICVVCGLILIVGGCAAAEEAVQPTPEYAAEIEDWKAQRDAGLRRPDGWLTLVGLFWLEEGENTFGSDAASDVIFPVSYASRLGVLTLGDGVVTIEPAADSGILHGGQPVAEMVLAPDTAGDPTILELGRLTFHLIERAGQFGIRIKDSQAEALKSFAGMDYFPVDPAWRIEARFERFAEPRTMLVPNVIGTAFEEPVQGVVRFSRGGREYELTPVGDAGKPLFFVFGDKTNGEDTYGGGRFLYADWPGEEGVVILDFNRAYNPPCVFSPYATCPLPAPENELPLAIEAGELSYGSSH